MAQFYELLKEIYVKRRINIILVFANIYVFIEESRFILKIGELAFQSGNYFSDRKMKKETNTFLYQNGFFEKLMDVIFQR